MHACSKENQPHPGLHKECCQQAKRGVPFPLLSPGDTCLEYWVSTREIRSYWRLTFSRAVDGQVESIRCRFFSKRVHIPALEFDTGFLFNCSDTTIELLK